MYFIETTNSEPEMILEYIGTVRRNIQKEL